MNLNEIGARLRRLEDIEAARGMLQVYAETVDRREAVDVARLFAEDSVLHTPKGDFAGWDGVRGFFQRTFDSDLSTKRHFIVNPRVTFHEPGLVGLSSYFLYVGRGDDSLIGWGAYDDVIDMSLPEPRFRQKTITRHHGTNLAAGWARDRA